MRWIASVLIPAGVAAGVWFGAGRAWDPLVAVVLAVIASVIVFPVLAYFVVLCGTLGYLRARSTFEEEPSDDEPS